MVDSNALMEMISPIIGPLITMPFIAFFDYPITRIITIRQAQGAFHFPEKKINFQYSNVISCLRKMPMEQGGIRNIWRGLPPWLFVHYGSRPFQFLLNEQLLPRIPNNNNPIMKNFITGGLTGGILNLFFHPFKMANLKLSLDIAGGSLGKRASYQTTLDVLKQVSSKAGIVSLPFKLDGSLYRGFTATSCYAIIHKGLYFGIYDTVRPMIMMNNNNNGSAFLMQFLMGIVTTNIADFLSYPIRTGIVRAQLAISPASIGGGSGTVVSSEQYRGVLDAMIKVGRKEGLTILWRGFGLNLARSLSGTFLLISYDTLRR